jgi:hypothetical protein
MVPSHQVSNSGVDFQETHPPVGEKSRSRPETFRDCVVISVIGF